MEEIVWELKSNPVEVAFLDPGHAPLHLVHQVKRGGGCCAWVVLAGRARVGGNLVRGAHGCSHGITKKFFSAIK